MRRFLLLSALFANLCALSYAASAQEAQHSETISQRVADEEEAGTAKWKLLNSGIFALLLGYAAIKYGPKFFNARSLDIQKAIKEATGLKIEADFRYSEIDKKMSNLSSEVAKMRAEASAEMERQHQRVLHETAEEAAHIRKNSEAEIEAMQLDGERQVRRHTTQLAMGLAERRLQSFFNEARGYENIGDFVNLVERGNN